MKKILMLIIIGMFLISFASALTIDDIKPYDEEKREYTFTNLFGIGHEIGKMKINTPQNVKRGAGYQKVAEFTITNGEEDYEEIIKGMQLYMINDGMKEFDRDVDYKYQALIDVPDYTYSCKERLLSNRTLEKYDCENIQTGTHKEMKWVDFDSNSLLKDEEITIGLFTNVEVGDNVEWIMSVYGNERLTEWATWSYELNVQLSHYWDFNENTGTNVEDIRGEVLGKQYNGTLIDNAEFRPGKNGTGIFLDGANDFINLTIVGVPNINGSSDFAINLWVNETAGAFASMFADDISGQNWDFMESGGTVYGYMENNAWSASSDNVTNDGTKWTMLTWTRKGDNQTLYSDGYIIASATRTQTPTQANTFRFGTDANEGNDLAGMIDEYMVWNRSLTDDEVINLFNGGNGIFYYKDFSVMSIVYPENISYNSEITQLNYTFSSALDYCWNSNDSGITNSSTVIAGVNWTGLNSVEGSNTWTVYCNDSLDVIISDQVTFKVDTIPPVINITSPHTEVIYHRPGDNLTLNWTVSDANLDSCWYEYQGVNTTATCLDLNTTFLVNDYSNRTINFWVNDSGGLTANDSSTWIYQIWENSRTFNATSYETLIESYIYNMSTGGTISSATLLFNGTNYPTTNIGNLTDPVWRASITQQLNIIGTKEFNWSIDYGLTYITNASNQVVGNTIFNLCNVTLNTSYINFSFKDEADNSDIIASITTSTFNYWLGDGSVNKTLTFINTTANPEYLFCLTPVDKNLNVDMVIQYKNTTSYPQRTYDPPLLTLTNSTTNKTLYLLNTVDGIYVTFQVVNTAEQPISGVSVNATRIIGSEPVIVGDGVTDAAGAVTFWLNPDFEHTISFFKIGFALATTTIFPTQSSYTITLGGGIVSEIDDFTRGISILLQPRSQHLFNGTTYSFNYSLSSSYWIVDEFGLTLRYVNGTVIGTDSAITNGGVLNINANTYNSLKIFMDYYYIIDSNYTNGTSYWLVSTTNDYSIWNLFTNIETHIDNNLFGIQGNDEGYFAKALISVVVLILVSGGLSLRYGIRSEAAITGIIFGLVLLLNTLNMIPTPDALSAVDLGNVVVFIVALLTVVAIFKEEQR